VGHIEKSKELYDKIKGSPRNTKYSDLLWTHVGHGGTRNKIEAAKFKRMGVKPGVPDVMIFDTKLALELKVYPNKITPAQKDWLDRLMYAGWKTFVVYSLDEAMFIIDEYCARF